jgi:hypothetical protein
MHTYIYDITEYDIFFNQKERQERSQIFYVHSANPQWFYLIIQYVSFTF